MQREVRRIKIVGFARMRKLINSVGSRQSSGMGREKARESEKARGRERARGGALTTSRRY
jgi:hypothetical protein